MGLFSTFFKQRQPKRFEYKPRFYDSETEDRKEKLKKLRAIKGKRDPDESLNEYVPGNIIRGSISSRIDRRQKNKSTSMIRVVVFACLLFFVIYLIYTKDLSKLISFFIRQ